MNGYIIRARSDVGFKEMLSNPEIAQALINELFKCVDLGPVEIDRKVKGKLEIPLARHGSYASMDYHGITTEREHVIIEMQVIRHDNFDKRVLFYAASTFANQEFEGGEWAPQIRDVYAIQFVDYSTDGDSPIKYYKMVNKLSLKVGKEGEILPFERIEGIHLIQVELKGKGIMDIEFPVQKNLSNLEWWLYIIKYSDQFDEEEIKRCRKLGMPEQMAAALNQLKYAGLDSRKQIEYVKEVEAVDTYANELDRIAAASKKEGELKGALESDLKGLLDSFIEFGQISQRVTERIRNGGKLFSEDFAKEVGNSYVNEKQITEEQLEGFIQLLGENKVLGEE